MKQRSSLSTIIGLLKIIPLNLKLRIIIAVFLGFLGQALYIATIALPIYSLCMLCSNQSLFIPLWAVILITILSGVLKGFVKFGEQYMNHYIAFMLLANIRGLIYDSLERLSPSILENKKQGDLIELITADIETIEVFYAHTISPLFIAIFSGIFSFLLILFLGNYVIALMFLWFYILLGFILPLISYAIQKKKGEDYRKEYSSLSSNYLDMLNGVKEVRFIDKKDEVLKDMYQKSDSLTQKGIKTKNLASYISAINDLLMLLISTFILFMSIGLNIQPSMVIFGACIAISSFAPALALINLPTNLTQTFASGKRVLDLLNSKEDIEEIKGKESNTELKNVKFDNVSFNYPCEEIILKGISHEFPSKGIVAIKGISGVGKSTILKLIFRHIKPTSGKVLLSNIDLEEIDSAYLRNKIALMNQSTYLFNESIRDNMKEAKLDATDEEIYEALKKVKLDDFVNNLNDKLDTIINSDYTNISTGQKQRLGLARIFLRNPNILLLDEPTSNVDWANESYIFRSINEFSKEYLVILITHQDTAISYAKEIYEIKDKNLVLIN